MNIGDTYTWTPSAFEGASGIMSVTTKEATAHGRVVYINRRTATLRSRPRSTGRSSERALNFNKNQEEFLS